MVDCIECFRDVYGNKENSYAVRLIQKEGYAVVQMYECGGCRVLCSECMLIGAIAF
jgi:hypothetical protein